MEDNLQPQPEIIDDFSPLQENVKQREYTKPNVQGLVDSAPIEEPSFAPPSFEDLEAQFAQQSVETSAPEPESANPYVNNLDSKDQRQASKALVEAVLDGYTQLNRFGSKWVQIKVEVVQNLMRQGEIDPNLTLPVDGRNIPVLQYIEAYNAELGEVFSVDDEFKDKVRPVMLRVFMKRNIGMTDEQLLLYYFGIDIVTKGSIGMSLAKQNRMLIDSLREVSMNTRPAPTPQASRVEKKVDEFDSEPPISRSTVNKKEREYVEPEEEAYVEEVIQDVVEVKDANSDVRRGRKPMAQPEFGDSSLLSHMEQVANEGTGKRRGRPRKSK